MKKCFLIIIISILSLSCSRQINQSNKTESKKVLDSIVALTKIHSIYKNDVDWAKLEKRIYDKFVDSDSISSIIEPVKYMLSELGDFHGFFTIQNIPYKAIGEKERNLHYDNSSKGYKGKMNEIYENSIKTNEITGSILKDSIAYIEIPMVLNYTNNQEINIESTLKIRKKITELNKYNPKGYIIDLRRNLGGTIFPMLAGLGELFNNISLGGMTKDGKTFSNQWYIKDGNIYMEEENLIPDLPKTTCNCDITKINKKVAVLIGRYTASSGELVASSLKSQKNVMLFGEQTMGMSTTTGWFLITSNVAINPATTYYMSKDKTAHIDGVIPDISIEESFDNKNPTNGNVIEEAKKWISTGYNKVKD